MVSGAKPKYQAAEVKENRISTMYTIIEELPKDIPVIFDKA